MYDIFKPRFLQSSFPPRILIGVSGGSTTTVDTVAREAAAAAQESVDAITAQIGDVIAAGQGVISSDGLQFENKTSESITLTGTTSSELLADGLTAVTGSSGAGSAASAEKVSDLINDTNVSIGDRVEVRGYYRDNDGGGNVYEIVAAGTGTADGGAFIDLTGSGHQAKGLFPKGHRLEQWGAVKDGVSDDAPKITAAIEWCFANDVKSLHAASSGGSYAIAGNIQLKENVHLDFGYNRMIPLTEDSGFTMGRYGSLENLNWDAAGLPNWQGPLILVNDQTNSSISSYPRITNITCVGYRDVANSVVSGVMISLDATAGTRVSGVRGSGLNAVNLDCVAEFKPSAKTLSGWVNSNHLEFDMIYNCKKCFTMNRVNTDHGINNNYVKATYQTASTEQSPVLSCDGEKNEIDLLIWDWSVSHGTSIELGAISEQNLIKGSFDLATIKDASSADKRNQIATRTFTTAPFSRFAREPSSAGSGIFMGQVDNTLAYADKRYNVTAPGVSTGNLSHIFTPNQNARAVWNNLTSLAIEIDLLSTQTAIRTFGVIFADDFVPDWVLFEKSADGVSWQEVKNLPGSRATFWASRGSIGGSFRYLRVTVTTSVAQTFAIAQVFGWWKGEDQGAYLPTGGGDLYGDTTVNRGSSVKFTSSNGAGSGGVSVDNGNRLMIAASGGVKLNGTRILGDQQPAVADPTGGSVVDVECRAALIALADRIRNHGLIGL